MKLIETTDDHKTVKLGIVKLGTAVGKMKYSLIDESDIPIINEYKFDARLEIDRNGDGLQVIAMGHPKAKNGAAQGSPIPLQNVLWENRHGPIEKNYQVVHLNGISMDNRLDNLTLVPTWIPKWEQEYICRSRCTESWIWEYRQNNDVAPMGYDENGPYPTDGEDEDTDEERELRHRHHERLEQEGRERRRENKTEQRKGENSLYWKAIHQLLNNETQEQRSASSAPCSRAYYTTTGELITREFPSFYFFECHYPPCTAIETEPREFSMCGRCQQARYCGRECQRDDWTAHRDHCNESSRRSGSSRYIKPSSHSQLQVPSVPFPADR